MSKIEALQIEPHLLYGDYFIIAGHLKKHAHLKSTIDGVLSSTGFTDNRIFFQTLPFNLVELAAKQNNDENLAVIQNYRDFIFQVWPKLNYEAHKEYRRLKKEKPKYDVMKDSGNDDDQALADEYEYNLQKAQSRRLEEAAANKELLEVYQGSAVSYGSEIQLMHVDSESFLDGKVTTAEFEKSAYTFVLSDDYNAGMIFRILPKYQVCHEGDPIHYDQEILLQNTKLNCYVNFARDGRIDLDIPIKVENVHATASPYKTVEFRKMDPYSVRFEAHLSEYKETSWRLLYYRRVTKSDNQEKKETKSIMGGDLIRLRHMGVHGYVAADIAYEQENPEVYVRKYSGDYPEESLSVSEIWEVEQLAVKGRGSEIMTGNCSLYKLRHFLTGRIMILDEVRMDQARVIPLLAQERDEKAAIDLANCVSFIPLAYQQNPNVINGNSYALSFARGQNLFLRVLPETTPVNSMFNNYSTQQRYTGATHLIGSIKISARESFRESFSQPHKDSNQLSSYFKPLKDSEFCVKRKPTYMDTQKSSEHTFVVEKLDDSEKKDVLFAASALTRLHFLRDVIKAQQTEYLTSDYLTKALETLEQLIFFVVKVEDITPDPFTCEGLTWSNRQRLLKDMKLIEVLIDILFYPFALGIYRMDTITNPLMIQVFQLSNKLIKHTIREYRPNELYASQWLDLFIYQSMFSDSKYDLLAELTLTELIDNNKRILESKINPETISKFIGMLTSRHPHPKYVNLLRALTVCDREPMMKNQDAISTLIFEDEHIRDQIVYRIEFRENQIIFINIVPFGQWIELCTFQAVASERGGNDALVYDYYIGVVYLLADLCLSRNYIAIDGLKEIYTYELCFEILSSEEFPIEMRSAFAKLFNHLWVDKTYQPLNVPNYLITWDDINSENCREMLNSARDSHEHDSFKEFLQEYFQNIATQGYMRAFEEDLNKMTYILLENCKLLVSFGFYTTVKDIESLLHPLMKMLNGLKDVTTVAENEFRKGNKKSSSFAFKAIVANPESVSFSSRYQATGETETLMQIKLKALEIIGIIKNFFKDMHMRSFLAEFKKQQETKLFHNSKPNSNLTESTPQDWVEEICSKKELDAGSYSHTSFSLILADLLLYENSDLQKLAFEILYDQHFKRWSLKKTLSLVHLVDDHETIINIQIIRRLGERVQELAETTEKWYGKSDQASEKLNEEVLEAIRMLSEFLKMTKDGVTENKIIYTKKQFTQSSLQTNRSTESDEIFEFGTGPHPIYQKILRYMNTYKGVLDILNYDLKGRIESDDTNPESSKRLILKACVKFLARFACQDKENQAIVNRNNFLLLKMLKKDTSLGLESIIVELFYNNKSLLSDSSTLENYLLVVVKLIEYLPNSDLRRGKLLLTFNSLMKYKDNTLKKNQTLVINCLSRKEYATLIPDFELDRTWETLEEEFKNYDQQLNEHTPTVMLPGELDYLVSLLDVLAVACEGKNAATESKCQILFPLQILKNIYNLANKCYYVKYAVMYFLYHVYLDTEKETLSKDEQYLSEMFVTVVEDLQVLLDSGWSSYEVWANKGIIASKRIEEVFVFEGVILNLTSLFRKKNTIDLPNYEYLLQQTVLKVKQFNLAPADHYKLKDVGKLYRILEKYHHEKLESMSLTSELLIKRQEVNLDVLKENSPTLKRYTKNKTMLTKFKVKTPRLLIGEPEMLEEQTNFQKLMAQLESLNEEAFTDKIDTEFDAMTQMIINIERAVEEGSPVTYRRVIEALIDLILREEDSFNDDLKTVGIRIFRRIIEREVPGSSKPAAEWESKDWIAFEKRVRKRQDEMTNFGVVGVVCQLLPKSRSEEITEELILLAISLLIGGNHNVQKVFLDFMKNDTQSLFILAIRKQIISGFEEMKKEMVRLNERLANRNIFHEEDEHKNKTFLTADRVTQPDGAENVAQIQSEITDNIDKLVKLFRLLQLFCEGHNFEMQNHLRIQLVSNDSINVKSFDFLSNSAVWFASYIKFANASCLDFGNQLLDFLIEAVQGPCPENQRTLVASKIINSCMDYATMFHKISEQKRRGFTTEERLKALTATAAKAMKLLYSLLEGNTNESIIQEMCLHIDFKFVINKLTDEFESFCKRKGLNKSAKTTSIIDALKAQEDPFDDEILEEFGVFILLLTLADHNKAIADILSNEIEDKTTGALSFFKANIANIEIIFYHEQLIKVYFPLSPETRFLSRTSKKYLMEHVKRDSPNEKIHGLLNSTEYLFDEMEHFSKLSRWRPKLTSKRLTFLRNLSTVIALVINLIILFTYVRVFDDSTDTGRNGMLITAYMGKMNVKSAIHVLGIIQIIILGLLTASWVMLRAPLHLRKKWRDLNSKQKFYKKIGESEDDLEKIIRRSENHLDDIRDFDISTTRRLLLQYGPECSVFMLNGKRCFGNPWTTFLYYWTNATFLLSDGAFRTLTLYLIISILGLFGVELVYSLLLLDVVNRFSNLKNVVRAVSLNGRLLIMTGILGLIFVFIYTIFGFWFLDDLYTKNSERSCTSMLHCFITTLNYGVRSLGGVGDVTETPSYDPHTRSLWWTKVIWELTFFIVVDLIFLNLLVVTIIFTFGTLRKQKEHIEHDMQNKCFICDIDRWKLDKDGKGFFHHIQYNHHLWNYVYYLYMLKKKDPLEYNGIESYIASKHKADNLSWFPNGRSLDLAEEEENEVHMKSIEENKATTHESHHESH